MLTALCLLTAGPLRAQIPSFPGALGFGAAATGGRTGSVYHVTTLADSGTGSFRDAVSSSNRTIVFDVSGYITLNSAVSTQSSLTIAGQTAPGGGIGFKNYEVSFAGRSNIICRFLRFRPGSPSPSSDDCLSFYQTSNLICDHVSLEFAKWNNIDAVSDSTHGSGAVTVQNSIIANPIGQQFGAHTECVGGTFSWYYNLFANSHNRNPLAKTNTVFVNNVHYNNSAGYTTHTSTKFKHDIVNNLFIFGPASSSSNSPWYQIDNNQSMYFSGNLKDTDKDGALNGSSTVPLPGYQGGGTVLTAPWSPTQTNAGIAFTATGTLPYVLSTAGALPRDEMDGLVISQTKTLGKGTTGYVSGTVGPSGGLYTSEAQTGLSNNGFGTIVSGVALPDSDKDGMPDVYESALGWNPGVDDHATLMANNGTLITGTTYFPANTPSGYTRLEEYLQFMAIPHAITAKNSSVTVDLRTYASGYTAAPTFSVPSTSISGGTVAQFAADGVTASTTGPIVKFTPTTDLVGRAMFNFKVLDGSGNTITQTFALLVSSTGLPHDETWVGSTTLPTAWDTTSALWNRDGAVSAFANGDNAFFDDSSVGSSSITVASGVTATSMSVVSSKNYTFGGSLLTVLGSLVKDGSGTLTLSVANAITGGATINDGTVALGLGNSLGSGLVTLNAGGLNIANTTFAGSLAVPGGSAVTLTTIAGNPTSASGLNALTGGGTLNVVAPYVFDLKGDLSGFTGTLAFSGGGGMRFNGTAGSGATTFDLGSGTFGVTTRNTATAIALGALKGGVNTTLSGAGGGSSSLVTYTIGGNGSSTQFDGKITDGANGATVYKTSIAKTGSGTLTLTNPASTYTGTTTVSGGTLIPGNNTATGLVTVNSGGTLSPGGPGTVATITANGGFTLAGGTIAYDLSNSPTGANDRVTLPVAGTTLTVSGATVFKLNFTNGVLGAGVYNLIDGASTSSAVSGVTLNISSPMPTDGSTRQTLALSRPSSGSTSAFVKLTVTGEAGNLTWTGASSNAWDLKTSSNWNSAAVTGNANQFYNFDTVNLGDPVAGGAAINGAMTVTGSVQPNVINASANNTNYSFTGAGTIDGSGKLVKSGSGTLTIGNTGTNTYTGGTFLSGGTLAVNVAGGLGTGTINISGGALSLAAISLSNSMVFSGSSAIATNGNATLVSATTNTLTSSGAATVDISGVNGILTIGGDMSGFSGTFALGAGSGTLRLNGNTNANNGSVNTLFDLGTGSGKLANRNGGNAVDLGAVQGGPNTTLLGRQTAPSGDDPGSTDYSIGALNTDNVFAGAIVAGGAADTGAVVNIMKVGMGNWTLSGTSSFTGDVLVAKGMLTISGAITNNGDFEAEGGATLALSGGTINTAAVTIDKDATLSGCGTINADLLNQGTVRVNCSGTLTINGDFENDGVLTVSGGSVLAVNGALVNNGTLDLLTSPQTMLPADFVNNGTVVYSGNMSVQQAVKSGANMQIMLQTFTGHSYQLQRTSSMSPPNWQPVAGQTFTGTGSSHTFTDAGGATGSQGFYRVLVTP